MTYLVVDNHLKFQLYGYIVCVTYHSIYCLNCMAVIDTYKQTFNLFFIYIFRAKHESYKHFQGTYNAMDTANRKVYVQKKQL